MNIENIIRRFKLSFNNKCTERQKRLAIFEMILDGSIYDNLVPFYQEYNADSESGMYVRLINRCPSVRYKLAKIIVNDVAAMIFGESHFPEVSCSDVNHKKTANLLKEYNKNSNLRLTMINAVKSGSVGSVAIVVKFCDGNFIFEVLQSRYLRPVFDRFNSNKLIKVTEKKHFLGNELVDMGYEIPDEKLNRDNWCIERVWTENEELYYMPYLDTESKNEKINYVVDEEKSTIHNLGFMPIVWIKNPDDSNDLCDGHCIFEDIIDICFEIDYQLSQHGRMLKYNSDPTLVVKDPTRLEGEQIIKGIGSIMLGADGDAKFLQLTDGATKSVLEYVKHLRQIALEVIRGDRSNPDKLLSGNSGRALQMMNRPLLSLVDELRISYGEIGLLNIYKIMFMILSHKNIDIKNELSIDSPDCANHLCLIWPPFYSESAQDIATTSNALQTLTTNNIISKKTATQAVANYFDIDDIQSEEKEINKDKEEAEALNPQVKESINI